MDWSKYSTQKKFFLFGTQRVCEEWCGECLLVYADNSISWSLTYSEWFGKNCNLWIFVWITWTSSAMTINLHLKGGHHLKRD